MTRVAIVAALLTLACSPRAEAGKSQRWEINTHGQFMKGKLDRLILTSDAELRLGYGTERLGEVAKEIWCSVTAPDGTIYFGTGTPADVYALAPGANAKPARLLQTPGVAVTALALDAQGNLYAGTMADGKIYKLTPAQIREATARAGDNTDDGTTPESPKPWCQLPAPYVWSLLIADDGALFVGSGPGGAVYRVDADGKATPWFTASDSNILCLAREPSGALLAGGSDRGVLYRIQGQDDGEVVHEFDEDEVKSLAVRGDEIFVGVNRQKTRRPRATTGRPAAGEFERLTQELTAKYGARRGTDPKAEAEAPMASRMANLLSGAVYVRRANGRMDKLANWENESLMVLQVDNEGRVLTGMANEGRVYRVTSRQSWELLVDLGEQQAMTLALRDGHLAFVGTGNIGVAYRIDREPASEGVFTSEVFDAQFASRWGNVIWRGDGSVALSTRTGNTKSPDNLWSDWTDATGDASRQVTSPPGRYIQLRARLANGQAPLLRSVTVHMQTRNQRPEMGAVTVDETKPESKPAPPKTPASSPQPKDGTTIDVDGGGESKDNTSSVASRPNPATTKRRIAWSATDPDGDTLVYRLFYQGDDDTTWLPVSLPKPLTKPEYTWDTESIPDGWYRIRVTASDEESNPQDDVLDDEQMSAAFKVDNRRPDIEGLAYDAANGLLTGTARDRLSLIAFLEYAVDGGDWIQFAPADGIFDARDEAWSVKVPALKPGAHHIAVRATDEEGNIGVEKISVIIAPDR